MSTRATILVKSEGCHEEVRLYHHSDGFPDCIGSEMKSYLGNLRTSWDVEEIVNDLVKGKCANDIYYEFTLCQHGDEKYAYVIDCDNKAIKCYAIGFDDTDWPDKKKEVEIP